MGRRRPDLFPVDRALQARMLLAIAVTALLGLVVLGGLTLLLVGASTGYVLVIYCLLFAWLHRLFASVYISRVWYPETEDDGWYLEVEPAQQERLGATVERLCLLADVPAALCTAYPAFIPQSYTIAPLRRRPTVYVSEGMLRALDDRELDAVVAHELSHIANRDAELMTWLMRPTSLFGGHLPALWAARHVSATGGVAAVTLVVFFLPVVVYLAPLMLSITACARLVSRQRELYADRCAAVLTGSPAGVATTLMKVSGERGAVRLPDLRAVGGERDGFHILPDRPQPTGMRRIWATHPPVLARTARLEVMERELQRARLHGLVE
jgi:heat shock protein HtpX